MEKTQKQAVLDHLRYDPLTPLEALNRYGCMRLAAVIYDLKKEGHHIETRAINDKKTGKIYAQYALLEEA